ncbi:Bodo-specific multi-copy gene family, putative [Bodo saltans]|uniref:Bodo-specific multi-copy gene family, putative n=1 Tax=Bodo saltans TaxID=75058 RepID=A0A0S4J3P1_BODSA|nr:Bodo-specific multi-copy gene family, putative [Bodo saltans]|eukprot:CUG75866.1 Bodo-specific multi-copy gene family, putative [Bodo saltans]
MNAHMEAIRVSWKNSVDNNLVASIYHLLGWLSGLLRLAHQTKDAEMSFACGSLNAHSNCFGEFVTAAKECYSIGHEWVAHAFTCLLISSTKVKVLSDALIPVNPRWRSLVPDRTFDEAAIQSIGSYVDEEERFMLPAITFDDEVTQAAVVTNRMTSGSEVTHHLIEGAPFLPSQVHPFLNAAVVEHFGKGAATQRGQEVEKAFMYAVHARYLLALWSDRSAKPNAWISLEKVLEGAISFEQQSVIAAYEVKVSGGVKDAPAGSLLCDDTAENALTYLGKTAHHDAYIWCRNKEMADAPFAVPLLLRHGHAKTEKELVDQLKKERDQDKVSAQDAEHKEQSTRQTAADLNVALLLSVNQAARKAFASHANDIVMVNASAMSSVSWLWQDRTDHEATNNLQ